MKRSLVRRPTFAAMAMSAILLACSDSPTENTPDINPALLDASSDAGLAATSNGQLPQGAALFTGPGGMAMDATAEEFIQQVTLRDGTVLRTSGISVRAVPDESVLNPAFDRLSFGAANTGSLESVTTGTYQITILPAFDFIQQVRVAGARIRETGERTFAAADAGVITIESLNYFNDVYTCQLVGNVFIVERCDYQLGLLRGVIEFRVPLDDGTREVVQPRTAFAVPIMRRTIVARLR